MLLTWVVAALAVTSLALTARWWVEREDALGRRRPYPLLALVCAEVAVVAAVPVLRLIGEEHKLGGVASELAGVHATVRCQSLSGSMLDATSDLGHVRMVGGVPEHATLIKNEQCKDLAGYLRGGWRRPTMQEVIAVHVLSHESMHMAGITDEAAAECAAMQRDTETATLLGATHEAARVLALNYWLAVYPRMPDGYKSALCGPGLPMDEHRPDPPWSLLTGG